MVVWKSPLLVCSAVKLDFNCLNDTSFATVWDALSYLVPIFFVPKTDDFKFVTLPWARTNPILWACHDIRANKATALPQLQRPVCGHRVSRHTVVVCVYLGIAFVPQHTPGDLGEIWSGGCSPIMTSNLGFIIICIALSWPLLIANMPLCRAPNYDRRSSKT